MLRRHRLPSWSFLVVLLLPGLAAAQPADVPPAVGAEVNGGPRIHALRTSLVRDWLVTGIGAGGWLLSEVAFKDALAPSACRWCDRSADGSDSLNGLDDWGRGARWQNRKAASAWSNVVDFGVLPGAMLGLDAYLAYQSGNVSLAKTDALIVTQTVVVNGVLNQAVKFAVGRGRPFVHVLPAEGKGRTEHPDDNNVSFYSGHTSFAFSLVVSTGVVATMRDYPQKELVWVVGLPLAASVGYFRMAADKHYLTDVVVGALAGSAVGVAVPLLLHPRETSSGSIEAGNTLTLSATANSFSIGGTF